MGPTGAQSGRERRPAPVARTYGAPAPGSGPGSANPSADGRGSANGAVMASPPPNQPPAGEAGGGSAARPAPALDFAAEYQRAYRVLWVVAAGVLGRATGAEDVVQEAALLALGKLDRFEPGTHFVAWMAQ